MTTDAFEKWLADKTSSSCFWYVKRLSANDTLANGTHQAGPYFPNEVVFTLFPTLKAHSNANPRIILPASLDSHESFPREISVIWYNRKTRNECRITGWGGISSPLLDPEATGSVAIFSFLKNNESRVESCSVWLCSFEEELVFEELYGSVEPKIPRFLRAGGNYLDSSMLLDQNPCLITESMIPASWKIQFPSSSEIVSTVVSIRKLLEKSPDDRLIIRRKCEYELFRSIEELLILPRIRQGFETVDSFIDYSNTVNNRRKSRSGRSLELQLVEIFTEEKIMFSHGSISEGNKRPDFLFPSADAYHNQYNSVYMLAAKTTCKDRWRQILNEAHKIPNKHLITLQEGISISQHEEMTNAGVTLVVPKPLHTSYPISIRGKLLSLRTFLDMVRNT
jgi:hypothetical protein